MNILFFSTNSNHYAKGKIDFNMIPSCADEWSHLKQKYPDFNFTVVMQKPGMFLYDDSDETTSQNVKYIFLNESRDTEKLQDSSSLQTEFNAQKIAEIIIQQKPDVAIAVTYWSQPFDWMSIKDSMIAEILRENNIKTVCHPSLTSAICFDKRQTHDFLKQNGFNLAKGVYVHHEMFYAERNKLSVKENIYKEYVFSEIRKLKLPLVIKDTMGLSSFGMDVVSTYEEAKHVLLSKKNNGDRLVEEFLNGISFGIEVYGTEGNYFVTDPLVNSVNQFGLTSPKQNVKLGPVSNSVYKIDELKKEILRLAELLDFSGIAQIDLLYSEGVWYIIEINSRISGMTQTMAISMNLSLLELILFSAGLIKWNGQFSKVMNLKFPLLSRQKLEKLFSKKYVKAVNQIENHEAKQLRETGYSEIVFGQTEMFEDLMSELEELNADFSEDMEKIFYENSHKLYNLIK
ncbi:MAG: ATP-grasp domain-containing protein [Treponema sp.]|nr:ATP-grasp domain-containing protein [Candidatus Treponema merdequi]